MSETRKVSATLPEQTLEWLIEMYPDAKSDSERVAMAISDARKFHKMISANRVASVTVDRDSDGDRDPRGRDGENHTADGGRPQTIRESLDEATDSPETDRLDN